MNNHHFSMTKVIIGSTIFRTHRTANKHTKGDKQHKIIQIKQHLLKGRCSDLTKLLKDLIINR